MRTPVSSTTSPGRRPAACALLVGALGLFLGAPASVAASTHGGGGAQDRALLAWVGCWAPVAGEAEEGQAADLVCVRLLEGEPGARISTVRDREVVSERILRTDGSRHPVTASGCEGWEEATWSEDGRRLFLRSELECGDGVERSTTGAYALSPDGHWIDVQTVRVGGRQDAGVGARRFAPVSAERVREAGLPPFPTDRELAARTARIHAAAPLALDDVAEAARHVDPAGVQVLLLETDSRFDLSAERVLALRDQGVDEEVIDIVVAVSFPERFQVDGVYRVAERTVEREAAPRRPARHVYGFRPFRSFRFGGFYDPFFYDPFLYGFGFAGPYGWGFRGGAPVVVVPVRPDGEARTGGRVIQGRGYTRNPSGRASPPSRVESPPRTSRGSGPSASSSGNTNRVTPQGHRGSTRQDTGRTARPRGGSNGSGGSGGGGGGSGGQL